MEELSAEDRTERLNREQKIRTGRDPAAAVQRQGAGRDEAVQMEVVSESLVPSMEHGNEAERSPQMSAGKLQQGLRDGSEQDSAEDLFVAEGNRVQLMSKSKDQMEIADG